jgi:hypothetical protein
MIYEHMKTFDFVVNPLIYEHMKTFGFHYAHWSEEWGLRSEDFLTLISSLSRKEY